MTTDDESGAEAQMEAAAEAIREAVLRLLEDAAVNIEQLMTELLGEAFASAEGVSFLTGNGVKKPFGLLLSPTLPKLASGNATAVTADSLIDASAYLKASYAQAAVWMMSRTTFGLLRKLKNQVGDYIFSEGNTLINGSPGTLLGRPVLMAPSMPDVAGSIPVLLADWRRACGILDRAGGQGLQILRDPFSQATVGKVRYHARMRVGGAPLLSEAAVAIQVGA
jgi:HK97 family phage major capsid protein